MATHLVRATRPTQDDIDRIKATLRAKGMVLPIRGGEQTAEELADEAAKKAAEDEAAKQAEEEKLLNDAGKAALKKEREARSAAAKEAREAKAELEALRKEKAEADEAKRKADEAEAVKKGEFEKLATERADTITTLTGERDGLKAQIDKLTAALKPEVDEAWKAIPAEVTELYTGADDDVLGKREFMATHKKLIDALAGKAEETKNKFRQASGKTPPVVEGAKTDIEKQAIEAMARRYQ